MSMVAVLDGGLQIPLVAVSLRWASLNWQFSITIWPDHRSQKVLVGSDPPLW